MGRPLNVCHLGKFYPPAPGGIETHVQTLARAQVELGANVKVLCVNHANVAGRDVTWSRAGATETVEESDRGVRITRLGRAMTIARLDLCPHLFLVLEKLLADRIDVLHLHTPNPTMLLALTWMRSAARIVITHHSDIVKQRVLRHALSPFEHQVYGRAARILSSSEEYVGGSPLLLRFREKVEALPLGLDLSQFTNPSAGALAHAAALRAAHPGPLWLCVGRCVYYKGMDVAISALSETPGTLMIIGSGPMEAALKDQALRLGVADRIVWRGYANIDELIGAYLAATALWFPSTHRSEAYGLVQVEAMAAGCPVINTSIPFSGVAWVSRDGESGLTVPVHDASAFAAAARRLAEDAPLREKLSDNARRRATREFDYRLMGARSLDIYEQTRRTPRLAAVEHPPMKLSDWVRQVGRANEIAAEETHLQSPAHHPLMP